jgi:D-glycero-alpha-D-manno-heptose-7-phosphate kinase
LSTHPFRIINSVAPIRICDNGGWTDTWFSGHGRIFNIAVSPFAQIQLLLYPRTARPEPLIIHAENYGDVYAPRYTADGWDRHPLLEAAIRRLGSPKHLSLDVHVYSQIPAGASTGTSASVTVALIAALDYLRRGALTPHEIAYLAHSIETKDLGQQCGIQDQLCAAYGGVNYIDMGQYPQASVTQLALQPATYQELERRLLLVYLGKSHQSTKVHESVIRELESMGPTAPQLADLRQTALSSRDALLAADFQEFGQVMIRNTEAQRRLHPDLVGPAADEVIDIVRAHGALGWKVNGAGGDGGSLTILCGGLDSAKRAMIRDFELANPLFRVWESQLDKQVAYDKGGQAYDIA